MPIILLCQVTIAYSYRHPEEIATVSACCVQLTAGSGRMQPTTTFFALYRSLSGEANSKSCKEKASASLWFHAVLGKSLPPTWRKMMSGSLETRHSTLFNSAPPFAISRVSVKPPRPQISTVVLLSLKSDVSASNHAFVYK